MTPIKFPGMNTPFTGEGCQVLPTMVGIEPLQSILKMNLEQPGVLLEGKTIVSAWQMDANELNECIANGGVVFLHCVGLQPPVLMSPFEPAVYNLFNDPLNK